MNIQDLTYEQCAVLAQNAGDNPILLGFHQPKSPVFNFSKLIPHPEDPRFILGDLSPYSRKLVKTFENNQVLVGVFYTPENRNQPYPLSAQYGVHYIDKSNPDKDYGGGVLPSQFCYPPVADRNKGVDRGDYVKLLEFVNEGLKIKGINSPQFPQEDLTSYHVYWPRPEFDLPHPGKIGEEYRAEDGILRRLEGVWTAGSFRIELTAAIERATGQDGYWYSLDIFKGGRCIKGIRVASECNWPVLRERKFGPDAHDWERVAQYLKHIFDYYEIRESVPNIDLEEKFVYYASDEKLDKLIVMKKRVAAKTLRSKDK